MELEKGILEKSTIQYKGSEYVLLHIDTKLLENNLLKEYAKLIWVNWSHYIRPLSNVSLDHLITQLRNPVEVDFKNERYIFMKNHEVIGFNTLRHNTGTHNLASLSSNIVIKEEYRHQGLEKLMCGMTSKYIPEKITRIDFWVRKGDVGINDFHDEMQMNGARHVYSNRMSASDITLFNKEEVAQKAEDLRNIASSNGYDIIFIENAKFKSEQKMDYPKYVKLIERIWNDMPREDASWEDEVVTEEVHQSFFKNMEKLDQTVFTFIAILRETRDPIGYTETWLNGSNKLRADQEDTGVKKEHRGKNLGLTLKYIMLDKILNDERFEKVKYWVTGNANSNAAMLRINNLLKYEEKYVSHDYELALEKYLSYLE